MVHLTAVDNGDPPNPLIAVPIDLLFSRLRRWLSPHSTVRVWPGRARRQVRGPSQANLCGNASSPTAANREVSPTLGGVVRGVGRTDLGRRRVQSLFVPPPCQGTYIVQC